MTKERNTPRGLPVFTDIIKEPGYNYLTLLWHAASVHKTLEVQEGADSRSGIPGIDTQPFVVLAHHWWLRKYPERLFMLYEAINTVERLSKADQDIPPHISVFLLNVYQEINAIIWQEIWNCSINE